MKTQKTIHYCSFQSDDLPGKIDIISVFPVIFPAHISPYLEVKNLEVKGTRLNAMQIIAEKPHAIYCIDQVSVVAFSFL